MFVASLITAKNTSCFHMNRYLGKNIGCNNYRESYFVPQEEADWHTNEKEWISERKKSWFEILSVYWSLKVKKSKVQSAEVRACGFCCFCGGGSSFICYVTIFTNDFWIEIFAFEFEFNILIIDHRNTSLCTEEQPHALILYHDTVTILALNSTFRQPEPKLSLLKLVLWARNISHIQDLILDGGTGNKQHTTHTHIKQEETTTTYKTNKQTNTTTVGKNIC